MKPPEEQTYYELLELDPSANEEEVRTACDRADALFGADSMAAYAVGEDEMAPLRTRIEEAMATLADAERRRAYDLSLGLEPRAPEDASPATSDPGPVEGTAAGRSDDPGTAAAETAASPAAEEVGASPAESEPRTAETGGGTDDSGADVEPQSAEEVAAEADAGRTGGDEPGSAGPEAEGRAAAVAPPAEPAEGSAAPTPSRVSASGQARDLSQAPQLAESSAIAEAESALAKVSSQAKRPPAAFKVPPDAELNGEVLRQVRESKGLSLQQIADVTRVSARHLHNIEADRYEALPVPVYLRGILVNLARELDLDPERVTRSYLALVERNRRG